LFTTIPASYEEVSKDFKTGIDSYSMIVLLIIGKSAVNHETYSLAEREEFLATIISLL
jgi:hypothetical protein